MPKWPKRHKCYNRIWFPGRAPDSASGEAGSECAIPERVLGVKWHPSDFFGWLSLGWGHSFHAEALKASFLELVFGRWPFPTGRFAWSSWRFAGKLKTVRVADPGRYFGFDRRRSFHGDCTPSHPFVNPALLPEGSRAAARRPRTESFFSTILRGQARPNHCIVGPRKGQASGTHRLGKVRGGRGFGPRPMRVTFASLTSPVHPTNA